MLVKNEFLKTTGSANAVTQNQCYILEKGIFLMFNSQFLRCGQWRPIISIYYAWTKLVQSVVTILHPRSFGIHVYQKVSAFGSRYTRGSHDRLVQQIFSVVHCHPACQIFSVADYQFTRQSAVFLWLFI